MMKPLAAALFGAALLSVGPSGAFAAKGHSWSCTATGTVALPNPTAPNGVMQVPFTATGTNLLKDKAAASAMQKCLHNSSTGCSAGSCHIHIRS